MKTMMATALAVRMTQIIGPPCLRSNGSILLSLIGRRQRRSKVNFALRSEEPPHFCRYLFQRYALVLFCKNKQTRRPLVSPLSQRQRGRRGLLRHHPPVLSNTCHRFRPGLSAIWRRMCRGQRAAPIPRRIQSLVTPYLRSRFATGVRNQGEVLQKAFTLRLRQDAEDF